MKNRKLALRYAQALLEALPDPSKQESSGEFLDALAGAMERSGDLRDLLLDPAVPRSARQAALVTLCRNHKAPEAMEHFLATVVDHGRVGDLPAIAEVFREKCDEAAGIVPASLTTATPISAELETRARRALEKMTGQTVKLTCEVEPSLIGGAVTRIGSMVYDGSLRAQLARLRRTLAEE